MRLMRLAAAAVLATAWSAAAEEPALETNVSAASAPGEEAAKPGTLADASSSPAPMPAAADEPSPARPPVQGRGDGRWGVLLGAGLPHGATLSFAYRPASSVRLFAGPAWNYVGYGLQGGIAIAPWRFVVTPVVTASAGRYFGADVSFLTRSGQGVPSELSPLLKSMSYSYGALHAGIELGSPDGLSFAVDAGLAYVSLSASGTVTKTDPSTTVTFRDPRVRGTLPSLNLGLHYWF